MKILNKNNQYYIMRGANTVYLKTGKLLEENGNKLFSLLLVWVEYNWLHKRFRFISGGFMP